MGTEQSGQETFVAAVNFVIDQLEGGDRYTNDPNDAGGATRWGISRRANPDIDVRTLTRDKAVEVYHKRYWRAAKLDEFPPPLGLQYFAAVVNMGAQTATRCLQWAIDRSGVRVDGVLGPKTLAAMKSFDPQSELEARMSAACIEHYQGVAARYPYAKKWLHGWIMRTQRVMREAGRWGGMK